ncbi:MAG TPA: META domain-containing protein [Burkholderiales bacterium]|nr:META domain-containing protein [Burkholderiales bacterium]
MRLSLELAVATLLLLAARAWAQTPGQELVGTSWQVVRLQSGDRRTFTPDDKAKYTFAFGTGGAFSARLDCNRGSGTWKSSGPQLLEIAPFAITRALCPPGSLFDEIVKRVGDVRTYSMKDGRLYLFLMSDGGTLELEAIAAPRR